MIKQAVILAAGQGRRLWPHTQNVPKCLLTIGGKTILEYQVEALLSQKVERITVVIGYESDRVREVLGPKINYIENKHFRKTSSMYSLWLARREAQHGFLALNGDVLFHRGILESLMSSPHADALAIDFEAVLAEEEMKVQVKGERVHALSKTLRQPDGENVGMIKFSEKGSRILFAKIEELLKKGLRHVMVPFAVNAIASTYFIAGVSVKRLPWIEMDFPKDYQRARDVIYPAIMQQQDESASLLTEYSDGINVTN